MKEIQTVDRDMIVVDTYECEWLETNWGTGQSQRGNQHHVSLGVERVSVQAVEAMSLRLSPKEARQVADALTAAAEKLEPATALVPAHG